MCGALNVQSPAISEAQACGDAKIRELNLAEIEVVSGGSLSLEQPDPFPWKEPFGEVSNPWFQWGEGEKEEVGCCESFFEDVDDWQNNVQYYLVDGQLVVVRGDTMINVEGVEMAKDLLDTLPIPGTGSPLGDAAAIIIFGAAGAAAGGGGN
jgi:hypothetical protein